MNEDERTKLAKINEDNVVRILDSLSLASAQLMWLAFIQHYWKGITITGKDGIQSEWIVRIKLEPYKKDKSEEDEQTNSEDSR